MTLYVKVGVYPQRQAADLIGGIPGWTVGSIWKIEIVLMHNSPYSRWSEEVAPVQWSYVVYDIRIARDLVYHSHSYVDQSETLPKIKRPSLCST
jgi:hypothetical protein